MKGEMKETIEFSARAVFDKDALKYVIYLPSDLFHSIDPFLYYHITMSAIPILKPCPFCGTSEPATDKSEVGNWHVWCLQCGARSPLMPDKNAAIRAWNRRA